MFDGIKRLGLAMSPGFVIRHFARPYVAGYDAESALAEARRLLTDDQMLATIDLLGEEATSSESVALAQEAYGGLADRIAADPVFADVASRPTISLKLSALVLSTTTGDSVQVDTDALVEQVGAVATRAAAHGMGITIDMEDHRWTTATLDVHRRLHEAGHTNVGTVLQSRLKRTAADIDALPDGSRIRMVIGVYREPARIASVDKPEMKRWLFDQCVQLWDRGATVEIGTHDEALLERLFSEHIIPRQLPPERYEVQMLLGVPRARVQRELIAGTFCGVGHPVTVRLYVPYAVSAADGTAYCRRRLIENPDLVTYGLFNLVGRGQ